MDIGNIFAHEKTFALDIRHPVTGKPLGIIWQIRSASSPAAKAAKRKIIDDDTESAFIGASSPRAEDTERRNSELIAAHVASWDWGEHTYKGEAPVFSAAKVAEILLAEDWIYAQVVKAKNDASNFTAA